MTSGTLKRSLLAELVKLIGEGEYNLDALKEIKVTDSYLGLDQDVRGCQNEESLNNCKTKHYLERILEKCDCLPFNIRLSEKVWNVYGQHHYNHNVAGSNMYIRKVSVHENTKDQSH